MILIGNEGINELQELGIKTLLQLRFILACDPKRPPTAKHLCGLFAMTPTSISGKLWHLEQIGFLEPVEYDGAQKKNRVGAKTALAWRRTKEVDKIIRRMAT